jgi:hypothetical protein
VLNSLILLCQLQQCTAVPQNPITITSTTCTESCQAQLQLQQLLNSIEQTWLPQLRDVRFNLFYWPVRLKFRFCQQVVLAALEPPVPCKTHSIVRNSESQGA